MKIAIVTPGSHLLQHRVRGTGFYITNLENSLKLYDKKNTYISCLPNAIPNDVDLVHYPYFEPFFITLPLFKKKKTVVTVHDLIPLVFPKNFPKGIKGNLKWNIQKIALKNSNAIITDSKCSKNDIEKYTGISNRKIHVVYLAANEKFRKLNKEKARQALKKKFNLPERFILYVGDVTWNKNLPRLIEAVIKKDLPLVLVGKTLISRNFDKVNPWNQDLLKVQNLIENKKNIFRLGFVDDKDLVNLYNTAVVLAMPSIYEGFGLPILEAMNCGCPVVAAKTGSIGEIAKDAVFYVDPYDTNDIALVLERVFKNVELQVNLSKKGLEIAKSFTWRKTAEKTLNVYRSIL